jgi:hypothetical protein
VKDAGMQDGETLGPTAGTARQEAAGHGAGAGVDGARLRSPHEHAGTPPPLPEGMPLQELGREQGPDAAANPAGARLAERDALRDRLFARFYLTWVGVAFVASVCLWSVWDGAILTGLICAGAVIGSFGGAAAAWMSPAARKVLVEILWLRCLGWLMSPMLVMAVAIVPVAAVGVLWSAGAVGAPAYWLTAAFMSAMWLVWTAWVVPLAWWTRFRREARALGVTGPRESAAVVATAVGCSLLSLHASLVCGFGVVFGFAIRWGMVTV